MDDLKEGTVKLDTGSLQSQAGCPDRYEIKSVIGHGGMGIVFQGVDKELGRDVAIKVLLFEGSRDEEAQERFLREAKVLAVLNHSNIVRIFSSGLNEKGNPYHVMEFLKGKSLSADLSEKRPDAQQFFTIFTQILHGMDEAHRNGIVHRDLKPSNIMHCKDADGQDLYKIIDFGIARIQEAGQAAVTGGHTLTRTDAILGSPLYMSPQQCRGERGDERSDIYSIGCIMYECIAGEPPFRGESAFETMYMHMSSEPPSLEQKTHSVESKRLAKLIQRCLQKRPEDRPASISELLAELDEIHHIEHTQFDIFLTQKDKKKQKSMTFMKVAGWFLAVLVTLGIGITAANISKKSNLEKIVNAKQEKHARELDKAKSKLSRWTNPSSIKDLSSKKSYLFDLFALGRAQLDSGTADEIKDAENTYTTALRYCESGGDELRIRIPACLAMVAKAQSAQNEFEKATANFDKSIVLAKNEETELGRPLLIDIYLERSRMGLKMKKIQQAFEDFSTGTNLYRQEMGAHVPSDISFKIKVGDQVLDEAGAGRCHLVRSISNDLMHIQPSSQAQRVEMLVFANELTKRIAACKVLSQADTIHAANFSQTLFNGISSKKDLPKAVIDTTNFVVGKYASKAPVRPNIQIESLIEK